MDDPTTAGRSDDGSSAATHDRAREGVEHLQAAARELIEAARAALDVAEEVVNDPDALAGLAGSIATLGDVARRFTGTGGWSTSGDRPGDDHAGGQEGSDSAGARDRADGSPRVQRIDVTD